MRIESFFDTRTSTLTFLVWDEATKDAVVIDPVHDYDALAVRFFDESLERVAAVVDAQGLKVRAVLETHAHADHISGSQGLKERYGAGIGISEHIKLVQEVFGPVFNRADLSVDAFDHLLTDGEVFEAGSLRIKAIATPGHTPACMSFLIEDALFVGDALFMPDFGTGRCDFPKGSAVDLYASVQKLYMLPADTRVFVGHDYQPGGRALAFETTIGESRTSNKQLRADTTEEEFVAFRTARDAVLRPPRLLFQSIQANVDAGKLPPPDDNGMRYLRLPIGVL